MRLDLGKPLAVLKTEAQAKIDADAERCRERFITPGAGQMAEYQKGEAEARDYKAKTLLGRILLPRDYPFLVAEQEAIFEATGVRPTLSAVADEVIAQADAWNTVGAAIKRLRRSAKLRVERATTPKQIAAAMAITWPAA